MAAASGGFQKRLAMLLPLQNRQAVVVRTNATPVPGGVGPMTVATLLENTLEAAEQHDLARQAQG